jgi:outer membrane protein insertion porin family
LKYKNIFGYGDIWDGSIVYGCDNSAEVGLGMYLPRFRGLSTPFTSRLFLSTQDWLKFSSYKERSLGLSLGLFSSKYHELIYTIAWRNLIDPSQAAAVSIRRQLGHSLLSALKYTFRFDQRNSSLRPTNGYAFISTSQIGGLAPDSRSLRFLKQEVDLRYAVPFGFYNAAINFGVSGGVSFPWGSGYQNRPSSIPERFFLGGNSSPVCSLSGPSALWGFKTRGVGPSEPKRKGDSERDFVGGDAAVTAFADLSFDLPVRWLRERGIHGHVFACAGNMAKLSENEFRNFTAPKFLETFRTSVGAGIVLPTSLFRMELNYCHILKKQEHDQARSGVFLTFSASS